MHAAGRKKVAEIIESGLHGYDIKNIGVACAPILRESYIDSKEYSAICEKHIYDYFRELYNADHIWTDKDIALLRESVSIFPNVLDIPESIIPNIACRYISDYVAAHIDDIGIDAVKTMIDRLLPSLNCRTSDFRNCYAQCLDRYLEHFVSKSEIGDDDMNFLASYISEFQYEKDEISKSRFFEDLTNLVLCRLVHIDSAEKMQEYVESVVKSFNIGFELLKSRAVVYFDGLVDDIIEDGVITEEEEMRIRLFLSIFDLSQEDVDKHKKYEKFVQLLILQKVKAGERPDCFKLIAVPVVLGKTEYLIWGHRNVSLYRTKVRKEYVGGSSGVSVRVCKGVYYRAGAYKGQAVERKYMECVGEGILIYTNKNIIFYCTEKSVKIPYRKIISLIPYSDGFEIHKDGANAKPFLFENADSWFIINLLASIDI